MDDANWISDSLLHLEEILSITDEFYNLTRVVINKHKSKLLTNTVKDQKLIIVNFDKTKIDLLPFFSSVHFLKVIINIKI